MNPLNPNAAEFRPPTSFVQGPSHGTQAAYMPTAQTSGPVHTTQQQTPYGSLVQAQLAPPYSYGTTNLPTHTGGTTSTNQPVPHQAPYSVPGLPGGTSNPLPVTLIHRVTTGWPNGHPYLTANHYNGLHPSKVPDIYFLRDHINPYLSIKDPYKEGPFDASRTPWWTHWVITVANTVTTLSPADICLVYKWRYRNVIPKIDRMTPTDAEELWLYLDGSEATRYAFGWEERDEGQLRGWVWDFLALAKKELARAGM